MRAIWMLAALALGPGPAAAGPIDGRGPLRAELVAASPGAHEAVLPAALHSLAADGGLDLLLLGPDGQPRSFELYWARGNRASEHGLDAESYSLKEGAFEWESPLPEGAGGLAWLEVRAVEPGFNGKLKAELLGPGARVLAQDRALFEGQPMRLELDPPAHGRRLRLTLSGMDERFRGSARLLGPVRVGLRQGGQAFATQDLALLPAVQGLDVDGRRIEELSAALPGSGLWVERLDLRTRQALIGSWQLGRESLAEGRPAFSLHSQAPVEGLGADPRALRLPLDARWDRRGLRLRLDNQGRASGVERLTARVRLPRLAFDADQAGTYTLVAGSGQSRSVREQPVDEGLSPRGSVVGPVRSDPAWRPESLAARFPLRGGPLDADGYAWRAAVPVPEAGYWRMSLPDAVLLNGGLEGLRLARGSVQVPCFLVPDSPRSLSLSVQAEHDAKANRSRWTLRLPQPSPAWQRVSLHAQGVFRRQAVLEWRRSSAPVWQPLGSLDWVSRGGASSLDLPLGAWAREDAELRISMDHGDNQALALLQADAAFAAEALDFVVDEGGELSLWGGKAGAGAGRYDLDLLRQELQDRLPRLLPAPTPQAVEAAPWYRSWARFKAGSQAWFYLALGLVTAGLLVVIAKLLPRA